MGKTLGLSLLFLSGITLLCTLGFWQLSRSHEKQKLVEQALSAKEQKSLSKEALLTINPSPDLRFMPVSFKSTLLNEYTILLDNKTYLGQAGYHVLVPAVLDNNTVILVNRGWIPMGKQRTKLPEISAIIGEVTIEGFLDFAYRNSLVSNTFEQQNNHWPLRIQQIDWKTLSYLMSKKILPMQINLSPQSNLAFIAPIKEKSLLTPERHVGYAVQWFALAATLFVFFLIFLKKRKGHEKF